MIEIIEKTANIVKNEKEIALISHIQPDGDAIGSILALGLAIFKLGHSAQIVNLDGVPQIYTFLPGCDLIRDSFLYIPDTVILMDCSDLSRVGSLKYAASKAANVINIDHHISNSFFGKLNLVDTNAAATGEIAYKLIKSLGIDMDSEIATSLYTAIVTDTGSFQFENTTSETHLIAADLLGYGTNLATIRKNLWESTPLESIRLFTETLKTLELDNTNRMAWVSVPFSIFQSFGATTEHVEGIVNYPKSIRGVEIGMIFKEFEPKKVKVGLRSKSIVDVDKIAKVFGGGGHKRAAGCVIEDSLENAKKRVISEARKFLKMASPKGG